MGVSAEVACPRGCCAGVGSPEGLVKKKKKKKDVSSLSATA